MRVETHLHIGRAKKSLEDCLSVRDLPRGRVRYAGTLVLTDATFVVQPAGLARFRVEGQKNVHAFVRGENKIEQVYQSKTLDMHTREMTETYARVGYNPARDTSFVVVETGMPVSQAKRVVLVGTKVYAQIEGLS